ncbi:hypothetical protein Hanom_Chr10g00882571 [Helianthus anomalus]
MKEKIYIFLFPRPRNPLMFLRLPFQVINLIHDVKRKVAVMVTDTAGDICFLVLFLNQQ